jgi:hypothetical protein
MLWKLEGLSEYDARRPLTPTGTNLLGLVKHLGWVEAGYLGATFGRPFPDPDPFEDPDAEPLQDLWATADEFREEIVAFYRRVWTHSDATIDALPLDAVGRVPHWPEDHATVSLHRILVHVLAETNRHAGHADIVRELIDGSAGLRPDNDNLPTGTSWPDHYDRVEAAARVAGSAGT